MHRTEPMPQTATASPNWVELGRSPHWVLEREPARRIIRLRRTDVPMGNDDVMASETARLEAALAIYDRPSHAVLVDLRAAPLRSDPQFETRTREAQTRALAGFARVAVLVRTAVGRLQVTRARREAGLRAEGVFMDENDAIAYLTIKRH